MGGEQTCFHAPEDPIVLEVGITEPRRFYGYNDFEVMFRVPKFSILHIVGFCPKDLVILGKYV